MNPRPSPWQGDALPLRHFRLTDYSGRSARLNRRAASPLSRPQILVCRGAELNCRHRDFQSRALPPELPRPGVRRAPKFKITTLACQSGQHAESRHQITIPEVSRGSRPTEGPSRISARPRSASKDFPPPKTWLAERQFWPGTASAGSGPGPATLSGRRLRQPKPR